MSENIWHNVSNLSSQFGENISFTFFRPFSNIIPPEARKLQKMWTDCSWKISKLREIWKSWTNILVSVTRQSLEENYVFVQTQG